MGELKIYHGSPEIIEKPVLKKGKKYNDFGQGFYCTEHIELAKEWACSLGVDGYANIYSIDLSKFNILDLTSEEYTMLNWLALLVEYRNLRISTPIMKQGVDWLKQHFLIDIKKYDIIIGFRADDSYFSFARDFLQNEISLEQLSYAMRLGDLGKQIVLKSEKAFDGIKYIGYDICDNKIYYAKRKKRDEDARQAYFNELEKSNIEGIFIRDIIREEMQANDARLRL